MSPSRSTPRKCWPASAPRCATACSPSRDAPVVRIGDVEIDLAARLGAQRRRGSASDPKEFGFLAELAKHPGRVVTHAQLLRSVWGAGHERDVEYLRVAARGVRKKLEDDPPGPPRSATSRAWVGYGVTPP
jgi:two-component system KDP operon response regulator KdpE